MADSQVEGEIYTDNVSGFVAGLVGGCTGLVFGHPFDTVKVRQHIYSSNGCGLMRAIHMTTVHDGLLGFYKGMCFPLASVGMLNSIFFGVYDNVRTTLATRRHGGRASALDTLVSGAVGGGVQAIPATSIELVKVKLQAQTNSKTELRFKTRYAGALDCMRSIYHDHGLRGNFHGLGSTVMRDVPGFAIYMSAYELLCEWLRADRPDGQLGFVSSLWAGGTAGVVSWMVNIPIDVMKSRIQADDLAKPRYNSLADCAVKSYRKEGLIVFWRGLGVTCMRAFPLNAVTLTVYSAVLELLKGLRVSSPVD